MMICSNRNNFESTFLKIFRDRYELSNIKISHLVQSSKTSADEEADGEALLHY